MREGKSVRRAAGRPDSNGGLVMATSASPPDCWGLFRSVAGCASRILLHGPPGTGKTHAATHEGLRPGQLVHSVTLGDEWPPAAELRGHWVPDGDRFRWQDGPAIVAWRAGARLVLNELDQAAPDVVSLLLVLLDDPATARLSLHANEILTPAPGFHAVATMNGDPDDLFPALRDRFEVTLHVDRVAEGALAHLPQDVRSAALRTACVEEPRRLSVRRWRAFAYLRERLGEDHAATAVFATRAPDVLDVLRLARGRK